MCVKKYIMLHLLRHLTYYNISFLVQNIFPSPTHQIVETVTSWRIIIPKEFFFTNEIGTVLSWPVCSKKFQKIERPHQNYKSVYIWDIGNGLRDDDGINSSDFYRINLILFICKNNYATR
jgi:hypothetical protein